MGTHNGESNGASAGNGGVKESLVVGRTSQGTELHAQLVRFTRFLAVFEIHSPNVVLQTSEVLDGFKIIIDGRTVYSGRAVISGLVNTGLALVCEAKLSDPAPGAFLPPAAADVDLRQAYDRFFQKWQGNYRISSEFKVVVADIEAFLVGIRQWLDQMEFELRTGDRLRPDQEREILETIAPQVIASFNAQHERFEELAYAVPEEQRGVHQDFVRRHWHKIFLCSPFGQRTHQKPLGYAGDYEMMNMIYRNQPEGGSLYEKLIHLLLISQWPAQSVRNRFLYLKENIIREAARVARTGGRTRILNLGCGSAQEIQDFLKETPLSDQADFTLLDFNEETLAHTGSQLSALKNRFSRRAEIETRRISVQQLLRRRLQDGADHFDLIYCAGLFDYLSGQTCRSLVKLFYDYLRPDGLIVVANMNDSKPFRNFIEYVLDWQLFYRDSGEMRSFCPEPAVDSSSLVSEHTSVNLFLHVRRQN